MGLYIGETQINGIQLLQTWNKSLLGACSNIRFSIIDNVVNVKWLDPDNSYQDGAIVAKFKGTKLLMKIGSYPENETDGTLLVDNTTRNKYNDTTFSAALPVYEEEVEYYFRFFSYDTLNNYNSDTQLSYQNRFSSKTYSWNQVVDCLHNYAQDSELVPEPGSVIGLKYILNDYYLIDGNVKIACDTRQKVYDARDKLESVTLPWVVLGHNANVPQYINYRKMNQDGLTWDNIFVQSVDDSTTDFTVFGKDGTSAVSSLFTGDGFFRPITAGCKIYTESWDLTANMHTYTYTGNDVESASQDTFVYANEGIGKQNEYAAPKTIVVNGSEYQFCGYTMTMMPVDCLAGNTPAAFFNNIQLDAPEQLTASVYETYPTTGSSEERYYFLSSDGYHEIDWKSAGLHGQRIASYVVDGVSCDVYKAVMEENAQKMMLVTKKFGAGLSYFKLAADGQTEIALTAGVDYQYGDTIELEPAVFQKNDGNRRNSGSNLYSESNYRQYANNKNGSADASYTRQNIFDVVSTGGLMNTNGLLLKLFHEQDFISHVKTACLITRISDSYQHYCRSYKTSGNVKYEVCKDLFWALGFYEVFGDGSDGSATFNKVFTDNNSRIKKRLDASGNEGTAFEWWLRYPYPSNTNREYNVTCGGGSGDYYANVSYGFSPACILG